MYALVTPVEIIAIFGETEIVEATNPNDVQADAVNMVMLEQHCAIATGFVYGYLRRVYSAAEIESFDAQLRNTLRTHAAHLARESLDNTREEVRHNADKSRDWLEAFTDPNSRRSAAEEKDAAAVTSIAFEVEPIDCHGRRSWRYTF
jgi:lysyl-tRNA synthetase class I